MTQRKQVQKTDGMNETLVLQILLDLCFERRDIAQNIAVRDHHAFGSAVVPEVKTISRMSAGPISVAAYGADEWADKTSRKSSSAMRRDRRQRMLARANQKLSVHLLIHALGKVGSASLIDRNDNHSA